MHDEATIVFYVDDNAKARRLLTSILRESGFEVITASDPLEALGVCKETSFDLALEWQTLSAEQTGPPSPSPFDARHRAFFVQDGQVRDL